MIKKSLIVSGLLLSGTSVFAQNEYFMGIGMGSVGWKHNTITKDVSGNEKRNKSENESSTVNEISAGFIVDKTHKFYTNFTTYSTSRYSDMSSFEFGYALFPDFSMGETFKPFINISYLLNNYDVDQSETLNKYTLTTNTVLLGVGLDYNVLENQFISLGYGLSVYTSGSVTSNGRANEVDYKNTMKTDNFTKFIMSYNIKF
jgi:hypothetical protein